MADDPKKLILARRARFVAAALAGMNMAMCGGKSENNPQPCLSVIEERDDAGPRICLSPPLDPDSGEEDGATPQPCLSQPFDAGDQDADAGDADPDAADGA